MHSLDQEDEERLVKALIVRCGLLEEGQDFCVRVWDSVGGLLLWRVGGSYHDPNFVTAIGGMGQKLSVKGNKFRDVLK